jgi:hypothetical protein
MELVLVNQLAIYQEPTITLSCSSSRPICACTRPQSSPAIADQVAALAPNAARSLDLAVVAGGYSSILSCCPCSSFLLTFA